MSKQLDKAFNTASRTKVKVSYLYALVTYVPTGYGNDVMGVDSGDIANINGITAANISNFNEPLVNSVTVSVKSFNILTSSALVLRTV